jgi:hypothetical protein
VTSAFSLGRRLHFGAESRPQFVPESEIVAEVVNQGLPLSRIDVVVLENEIRANVNAEDLDFGGGATAQLLKKRVTVQLVDLPYQGLHLNRALSDARGGNGFAGHAGEGSGLEFILFETKLFLFVFRDGILPVRGASVSTWRHMSGEGRFTTLSGQFLRLCRVFVSSSNPTVMVQPSAQKEEMGARLGEPFWSTELISATGVPKYRIFGLMVTNGASFCLVMGN